MAAGVIFDCDGVLVDSEPLANRVFAQMVTAIGLSMTTAESMQQFMGSSTADVTKTVEARLGRALPARFWQDYTERCQASFAAELRPVRGVEKALDTIDLPTCVASSGSPDKIRFTLARTGLLDRFDGRIFSAVEVPRGKPAPDLFLHAASRMGFEPNRTVVVEDTARGVQAAVAAGMFVLGYAALVPAGQLAAAGARVFHDMADLPGLIVRTLAGPEPGRPASR